MRSTFVSIPGMAALAVLVLTQVARATDQVLDAVKLDGKDRVMMECPLSPLLAQLKVPDFQWQETSNWKGYTAKWEVKDGILLLAAFEARRDGKPVAFESILPNCNLPAPAIWYTGQIRIPVGEPLKREIGGYWGAVFERVVVLDIKEGKLLKTEELKNMRIKTRAEEREEHEKKEAPGPKKN